MELEGDSGTDQNLPGLRTEPSESQSLQLDFSSHYACPLTSATTSIGHFLKDKLTISNSLCMISHFYPALSFLNSKLIRDKDRCLYRPVLPSSLVGPTSKLLPSSLLLSFSWLSLWPWLALSGDKPTLLIRCMSVQSWSWDHMYEFVLTSNPSWTC